jgi:hypothetical protein
VSLLTEVIEGASHIQRFACGIDDSEVYRHAVVVASTTLGGGDVDLLRRPCHGLIHTALYALRACGIIDEEGIAGLLALESLLGTGKCTRQIGVEVSLA